MKFRNSNNRSVRSRNRNGSSLLELSAGAVITFTIVAFALNICFALLGYAQNDRACRDAARAAAQGTNSIEAQNLARRMVNTYNSNNSLLTPITVLSVNYVDFNGAPPADTSPFVSVTTFAFSRMPAPMELMGQKLFGRLLPLRKTYTFPIVRMSVQT